METPLPSLPMKHPEIRSLFSYEKPPPEIWWEKFPNLSWSEGKALKCQLNPTASFTLANKINYPDMATVMEIVKDITYGCDIGCRGVHICP